MSGGGSGRTGTWATYASHRADPQTLVALASTDAAELTGPHLVDAIVASEKALSLLAGLQLRMMAALAVPFAAGDPTRLAARLARKNCLTGDDDQNNVQMFVQDAATCLAASEIAAALRISPVTAGIRVREASTMTTDLLPTLHALEAGLLDRGKARIIAEHCQPLSPQDTADMQELVLPAAEQLSTSQLRDLAGEAVIIVDPAGTEDRHRAAAARRDLTLRAQPDAMATLSAYLTADGAVKVFQICDLLATGTAGAPGDSRGIGARRSDALVDIADQLTNHGYLDLADFIGHPVPDSTIPRSPHDSADATNNAGGAQDTPSTGSGDRPRTKNHHTTQNRDTTENRDTTATSDDSVPDDAREDRDTGVGGTSDDGRTGSTGDGGTGIVDLTAADAARSDVNPAEAPVETPASAGTMTPALVPAGSPVPAGAAVPPAAPGVVPTGCPIPAGAAVPPAVPTPSVPDNPAHKASAGRSGRALTRQGRRPHLSVTIGLDTLAGLNELPGKLAGFGAIPACLARAIATSAGTVTAIITDPSTGIATDAGELTYRPTQRLRDQVAALLNTCQFPSCRQPVWRCDIDHREPFDHQHPERGGRTDKANAGPFCRRHHLIKHHADWQIRVSPERFTLEWTSPTGHQYSTRRRPAAVPDVRNMTARITTAGTAIAERLDDLTAFNHVRNGDAASAPPSSVEELVTVLLLRHRLNQPSMYFQADETAWNGPAGEQHSQERADGSDDAPGDIDLPDEPPF